MPSKLNVLLEQQLKRDFAELDQCLLVDYQALNSEKMHQFRALLASSNLKMEVVKNSIFQKAVADLPAGALTKDPKGQLGGQDAFAGPTGIIHGGDSVVDCARFAVEWLKKNENTIRLKAALMGTEVFPSNQIVALSKLPSRRELLTTAVSTVQAPIQKMAATVQASYARVLWGMNALAEKLEKA